MKLTLKEDFLQDVLKHIDKWGFSSEGCACGEWGLPIYENLHINVYRTCRKSSSTPDHKLWEIHDIQFYKTAEYFYNTYNGNRYLDYIGTEQEDLIENVKLDLKQKELIINKLREVTLSRIGAEFRG